jgi:hypothetical protein
LPAAARLGLAVLALCLVRPVLASDTDASNWSGIGECWWPKLDVVLSVSSGGATPQSELVPAIGFLEANTGIRSGLEMTFVGYVLDRQVLHKSFRRWFDWFVDRYPYLYWDNERHVFLVDQKAQKAHVPTQRLRLPEDRNCQPPGVNLGSKAHRVPR